MKLGQFFRILPAIAVATAVHWLSQGQLLAQDAKNSNVPSASANDWSPAKATAKSSAADAQVAIDQAVGLAGQHKFEEAAEAYLKAIEISPRDVTAHNDLAWLLATCPVERVRNGKEAVVHATKACELTEWKNFAAVNTLAVALAESGQFDKAIDVLVKFRADAVPQQRDKIDARLAMFRSGKTYRQAEDAKAARPAARATRQPKPPGRS